MNSVLILPYINWRGAITDNSPRWPSSLSADIPRVFLRLSNKQIRLLNNVLNKIRTDYYYYAVVAWTKILFVQKYTRTFVASVHGVLFTFFDVLPCRRAHHNDYYYYNNSITSCADGRTAGLCPRTLVLGKKPRRKLVIGVRALVDKNNHNNTSPEHVTLNNNNIIA